MSFSKTEVPRRSFGKIAPAMRIPSLIQVQFNSFRRFQEQGLRDLLQGRTVEDSTGTRLELRFLNCEFGAPKNSIRECRERDLTYSAPLYAKVQLVVKQTGEIKEQNIFMGDIPMMTPTGTFIINGTERVVVSQLIRSPGLYLTLETDATSGAELCTGKLIPEHGAWLEFETSSKGIIWVKVNGKRRFSVTTLLRAAGYGSDDELIQLFSEVESSHEHSFIAASIRQEPLITDQNARTMVNNLLFNQRHYNLGKVGRYKLSKRLGRDVAAGNTAHSALTKEDLVDVVRHIIMVNNGEDAADDIDHLSNRRLRTVGELIQNQFNIALVNLERMIRERMSIVDTETVTPNALINTRPIIAAIREFFSGSQLCQFMDQTNPLAELTHKRRLSTLGPGGLSRERAGFEVRDIHHSHYGRICPIETPEGPNIGLISSLATYGLVDDYGFLTTPYRTVVRQVNNVPEEMLDRTLAEAVADDQARNMAHKGTRIGQQLARRLSGLTPRTLKVVPFVSKEIVYLSADREEQYIIAQANAPLNERGEFAADKIEVRRGTSFL
ncbi:MAG: DNA-directed RNA polymerase subunit beta, partial [Chloroflexi bacterium]|nr:DNA-directed RNA polymerase subunit beta [Chloroflexota bacterium]